MKQRSYTTLIGGVFNDQTKAPAGIYISKLTTKALEQGVKYVQS